MPTRHSPDFHFRPNQEHPLCSYGPRASILETSELAATAEAVAPYGLELEAGTIIAFCSNDVNVRLTSIW